MGVAEIERGQLFSLPAKVIAGRDAPSIFSCSVALNTRVCKKWIWLCTALLLVLWSPPGHAQDVDLAVDVEAPQVLTLLKEAMALERATDDPHQIRRAMTLYCKAARFGSSEAQFRFGMFYLSGRGVPKNLDFASSLFSQAAQQGHSQAMNMLETVKFRHLELPACML